MPPAGCRQRPAGESPRSIMDGLQIALLALIQGVTEFLPISSSAHLILAPQFFGWADQGLEFDLAVHLGTLVAVLGYFHAEVRAMASAWLGGLRGRALGTDGRLAWGIMLATLPAVIVGFLLGSVGEASLRVPWVIALTSIGFGLLLGLADWRARQHRDESALRWLDYLLIGAAQAVALVPGSSRSGMTILAGLFLGLSRTAAARLSFFLAIPITAAAIAYECSVIAMDGAATPWAELAMAAALACVSAVLAIHFFLRMLQRMGLMPFVIYRVILGLVLLAVFGFES